MMRFLCQSQQVIYLYAVVVSGKAVRILHSALVSVFMYQYCAKTNMSLVFHNS